MAALLVYFGERDREEFLQSHPKSSLNRKEEEEEEEEYWRYVSRGSAERLANDRGCRLGFHGLKI